MLSFRIPLNLAGVFLDVGSITIMNLVSGSSSYLNDDFVEPCRTEDVNMIACVSTPAGYCWNWAMGELKEMRQIQHKERTYDNTHLNSCYLDASGIPSFPFPPFSTHRPKTNETDGPVALTHFYTVLHLNSLFQCMCLWAVPNHFSTLGLLSLLEYSESIQLFLARGRSRESSRGLMGPSTSGSWHFGLALPEKVSSCSYSPRAYLQVGVNQIELPMVCLFYQYDLSVSFPTP